MQNNKDVYGEDIERLNLSQYGLSRLWGENLAALEPKDLEELLIALGNDEISLNLPLPCTKENVFELLTYSTCRECGKCCKPNPNNPMSPGIEVFEDELKVIAESCGKPFEELKKKAKPGSMSSFSFQVKELGFTRWLPLPCPFHDEKTGCTVYGSRAMVCQIYPVIFTGDDQAISVRATCEYGRDIITKTLERLRKENPDIQIPL
jgi:Fe-S-cluster containining protein